MDLRATALRLARSRPGGVVAWLALGPLRKVTRFRVVAETDHARAFLHPRPTYPTHFLIVPKRRVNDYLGVASELLRDVLLLADQLTPRGESLQVVTNLGTYQEVKLLHFHVVPVTTAEFDESASRSDISSLLEASASVARQALAATGAGRVTFHNLSSEVRWRVTT
jgi:diadenosine tetraphosphate (Ap4A) HIT family hydrolase